MRMMASLRMEPLSTTDRVEVAWAEAHPVVRRAVIAACVTAGALSTAVHAPAPTRWGLVIVGVVLAVAALVDLREHKLPNRLLAVACCAAVLGVLVSSQLATFESAVAGMVLAGGLMLAVRLTRGVGMGDVKMAAVVGASVGAVSVMAAPVAVAVAAFTAALYGVLARRQRLPLGPALWLGWAVSLGMCAAGWLS